MFGICGKLRPFVNPHPGSYYCQKPPFGLQYHLSKVILQGIYRIQKHFLTTFIEVPEFKNTVNYILHVFITPTPYPWPECPLLSTSVPRALSFLILTVDFYHYRQFWWGLCWQTPVEMCDALSRARPLISRILTDKCMHL